MESPARCTDKDIRNTEKIKTARWRFLFNFLFFNKDGVGVALYRNITLFLPF